MLQFVAPAALGVAAYGVWRAIRLYALDAKAAVETAPALFGLHIRDDALLAAVGVDRIDRMYVEWDVATMTETEQEHLKSNLLLIDRACSRAIKLAESGTVFKNQNAAKANVDLSSAAKVAAFAVVTWDPEPSDTSTLRPIEEIARLCFRAASCVYFVEGILHDGFEEVFDACRDDILAIAAAPAN